MNFLGVLICADSSGRPWYDVLIEDKALTEDGETGLLHFWQEGQCRTERAYFLSTLWRNHYFV
jgi:hypothetical protein